jgi:hypothetical protein
MKGKQLVDYLDANLFSLKSLNFTTFQFNTKQKALKIFKIEVGNY